MARYSAGTAGWASDPTDTHDDRPVIVLSHEYHPFSATDWTVRCAGTGAARYAHPTPELTPEHGEGLSFGLSTALAPWAIYTIPPNGISAGGPWGSSGRSLGRLFIYDHVKNETDG